MSTPIDLAAVAARINALDGWDHCGNVRTSKGEHFAEVMNDTGDVARVWEDGRVTPVFPINIRDLMPLLPVLQIVAEAMAHE